VTRKITAAAANIGAGSRERLALGNLAIRRDWGWAPEYVEAMWRNAAGASARAVIHIHPGHMPATPA